MSRAALREGLLVGILTFLLLTIVFSMISVGTPELVGFALISIAAGAVTMHRDRRSGSAAPER